MEWYRKGDYSNKAATRPKSPIAEEERTTPASALLEEEMEETLDEEDEESTPFSASEVLSAFLAEDVLVLVSLEVVESASVEVAPEAPTADPKPDWPAAEMTDLQEDGVVPVTTVAEPEKSQADLFLFCAL